MMSDQVVSQETAAEAGDFTAQDFVPEVGEGPLSAEAGYEGYGDAYQPPPGFKLIPEDYVGVEPTMYRMMLQSLGQANGAQPLPAEIKVQMPQPTKEDPDPVFHIKLLQQLAIGDIGTL